MITKCIFIYKTTKKKFLELPIHQNSENGSTKKKGGGTENLLQINAIVTHQTSSN